MKKILMSLIALSTAAGTWTPARAENAASVPVSTSTAPAAAPAAVTPAAAPAAAAPSDLTVDEISVGTAVQDKALTGATDSFSAATAMSVAVFTKVEAKSAPTTIKHVYTLDGKPAGEVSLDVGGSPWRTWSTRKVVPGSWKVEVQDAAGAVVASKEFKVTP